MKELEEFCAKINEAYTFLKDEENKARYDQGVGKNGPQFDTSNIFDFFTSRTSRKRKVEDTIFKVEIKMKDAFTGIKKKFKVGRNVVCKDCDGKGADREEQCKDCNGRGSVPQRIFGGMFMSETTCPGCNGMKNMPAGNKCKGCNGKKMKNEEKIIEIELEKGVEDESCIKYEGMGDEMRGCRVGDLIFQIRIKPNENFERKGMDIIGKTSVDLFTALTGGIINFEHLDGRMLEIKIDKVKSFKDAIVVPKEGFAGRGDLFLDVDYKIPKNIDIKKLGEAIGLLADKKNKVDVKCNAFYGRLPEIEEEEEEASNAFRQFFFTGH
ncbi:hypothetical protein GVAV_003512 [Gurleya vavrai]